MSDKQSRWSEAGSGEDTICVFLSSLTFVSQRRGAVMIVKWDKDKPRRSDLSRHSRWYLVTRFLEQISTHISNKRVERSKNPCNVYTSSFSCFGAQTDIRPTSLRLGRFWFRDVFLAVSQEGTELEVELVLFSQAAVDLQSQVVGKLQQMLRRRRIYWCKRRILESRYNIYLGWLDLAQVVTHRVERRPTLRFCYFRSLVTLISASQHRSYNDPHDQVFLKN